MTDLSSRIRSLLGTPLFLAGVAPFSLNALIPQHAFTQNSTKTLVAVFAHPDDEGPAGPILARYAREGAQVYVIIATDGAAGGKYTSIPRGPELARVRSEEARCSTDALGIHAPILLGFPDGQLGNYVEDPSRLYRLTEMVYAQLQQLHPDVLLTWGPDGGTGHPDHRLVSDIVTQLARAGAPGVPEQVFYASIPAEGMRAMNPARGAPPMLVPQEKYFTVRIAYSPADFEAAKRSMACHKTQFSAEVVERQTELTKRIHNGSIALSPLVPTSALNDLLQVSSTSIK